MSKQERHLEYLTIAVRDFSSEIFNQLEYLADNRLLITGILTFFCLQCWLQVHHLMASKEKVYIFKYLTVLQVSSGGYTAINHFKSFFRESKANNFQLEVGCGENHFKSF